MTELNHCQSRLLRLIAEHNLSLGLTVTPTLAAEAVDNDLAVRATCAEQVIETVKTNALSREVWVVVTSFDFDFADSNVENSEGCIIAAKAQLRALGGEADVSHLNAFGTDFELGENAAILGTSQVDLIVVHATGGNNHICSESQIRKSAKTTYCCATRQSSSTGFPSAGCFATRLEFGNQSNESEVS